MFRIFKHRQTLAGVKIGLKTCFGPTQKVWRQSLKLVPTLCNSIETDINPFSYENLDLSIDSANEERWVADGCVDEKHRFKLKKSAKCKRNLLKIEDVDFHGPEVESHDFE